MEKRQTDTKDKYGKQIYQEEEATTKHRWELTQLSQCMGQVLRIHLAEIHPMMLGCDARIALKAKCNNLNKSNNL